MKKFFSRRAIAQKSTLLAERFPISISLIVFFALSLFVEISNPENEIPSQVHNFFLLGSVISVAATLWLEDFVSERKRNMIIAAIMLLCGVYCFFLPSNRELELSKTIELLAIGNCAFLAMFFISFLKKDKDKAFWKFTMQMLLQLGLASGFGIIIFSGLSIAVLAVCELFDIAKDAEIFSHLAIFCYFLFSPLYFLANIPDKTAKHNEEIALGKILKILALYILTPIAAIYAVILYIYLFKVIVVWELPNGLVSYLVSSLMCVGLFVITLLYPARFSLFRYFGLLMLPLLVLMSIGIIRRFDDYGITIYRGYVLLLNIWFYGICIYLFITKAQRIKWILISFAVIALLSSIGPWSIPNITKHILLAEVSKSNFDEMKPEDKKKIKDKERYLRRTYGDASVQDIDTSAFSELRLKDTVYYFYTHNSSAWENEVRYIENFNTFVSVTCSLNSDDNKNKDKDIDCSSKNNQLIIKVVPDERVFSIPLREIVQDIRADKNKKPSFQGDDYIFLINWFSGNHYETIDSISLGRLEGNLFYRR